MIFDPFWAWKLLFRALWDLIFGGETTTVEGKTMGVLGMPEAGKTQFYKSLKGEPYRIYEGTAAEDYPEFNFKINQKVIKVKAGRDIGGTESYVQHYYTDFIDYKDIIVFVFDVKKYLEEPTYQRDVRDRLDFIWRKMSVKAKLESSPSSNDVTAYIKKKFILFGSHLDQLSDQQKKDALGQLHESVKGKVFREMYHNNMYIVDLRDRNLLFEIFEKTKLFG